MYMHDIHVFSNNIQGNVNLKINLKNIAYNLTNLTQQFMFLHISFIVISTFCNVQFETLKVPIRQMGLSSKGSLLNELFFPLRINVPLKIMLYSQLAPHQS